MNITERLKEIKPGENYPSSVHITEDFNGHEMTIKFNLNSYFCGMYCAIYTGESGMPCQTGDHNNKTFVAKLKKDIAKAIKRKAKVEIGAILPIKKTM